MIASEGYSTIALVLLFTVLVGWGASRIGGVVSVVVWGVLLLLCLLTIWFFRDPHRTPPAGSNLVISPADGEIVLIRETDNEYVGGKATQISIFLSPLDVHVNRVPVDGKLEYVEYFPGKFLMAWKDHASEQNEQAHFGVLHPSGNRFLFKQITGFLARRIVYNIREGDELKAGERFGIMKFGSRMDVILPPDVEVTVREGERTRAGESILGRIHE